MEEQKIGYFHTKVTDIKRCPNCQSIYVDDKICDSCNFRLDFPEHPDIFNLLDEYNDSLSTWKRIIPWQAKPSSDKQSALLIQHMMQRGHQLIDEMNGQSEIFLKKYEFYILMKNLSEFEQEDRILNLLEGITHKQLAEEFTMYFSALKAVHKPTFNDWVMQQMRPYLGKNGKYFLLFIGVVMIATISLLIFQENLNMR